MSSPASNTWVERLVSKHAQGGLLVDSNLLFVQVVALCGLLESPRVKGCSAYSPADAVLIGSVVGRFRRRFTTAHILAETSNLVNGCHSGLHGELFDALASLALDQFVEEGIDTRVAINDPCYRRLGLTDAAIAGVAEGGLLVFTNDFPLTGVLEDRGVGVIHYDTMVRPLED